MSRSGIGAVALATALLGAVASASADPMPAGPVSAEMLAALEADQIMMFGGTDLWRAGGFLHGGFAWAPDGLAQDGLVLKVLAGAGTYQYRNGTTQIYAAHALGTVAPGWIFRHDRFIAVAYAGPDIQYHWTLPADLGNPLRGTHAGVRLGIETWWEPLPDTMVKAAGSWSSVGGSYALQAAFGWRVLEPLFGGVYVGPELQAFGDDTYRQLRAGVHVTAWRLGPYEWSAGMGWVTDSDDRAGAYVRLGVLTKQ
ncbi:MAG: cellulose biosynthesis protein BcsS [Rhodoplanes sp.]|uniref:cellulose biosynthesis protein BcsS n=1 Tax=Rhodoplanes sp. TaxID=1968906 RepID=UPI0017BC783C|nr:cellulose biosynthesis protein BcsS [Rhodoplanes sp.]NVO15828.1 cellulose biosynthesis protein BcsS [Rhodoplanes sp.]